MSKSDMGALSIDLSSWTLTTSTGKLIMARFTTFRRILKGDEQTDARAVKPRSENTFR